MSDVPSAAPSVADLRIQADNAEHAQRLAASLGPDNDGFLDATVEGDVLVLRATADGVIGLLRTLDDALGCLRATGLE